MTKSELKEILLEKRSLTPDEIIEAAKVLENADHDFFSFLTVTRGARFISFKKMKTGKESRKKINCYCAECGDPTTKQVYSILKNDKPILCALCDQEYYQALPENRLKANAYAKEYWKNPINKEKNKLSQHAYQDRKRKAS
jgi:hypothetical protein